MRFKWVIALVVVAALVIAVFAITRGARGPVEIRLGPTITTPKVYIGLFGDAILLAPDGTVWGWGLNSGALLGTRSASDRPYRLDVGSNWVALAPGSTHAVGIKSDGTLWGWSFNPFIGAQGTPFIGAFTNPPTPVAEGSNWIAVAAGHAHMLALRSDGALFGWGYNAEGQVGDGTTNTVSQPVQIGTSRNWVSVNANMSMSAGIQSDGSAWHWGIARSDSGSFTVERLLQPTRMGEGNQWQTVQGELYIIVGQRDDQSLWVWGPNANALGATNPLQPHLLDIDRQAEVVGVGHDSLMFRKPDGSLWILKGTIGPETEPLRTGGERLYVSGWSGYDGTYIALDKDGTLWTWGTRLGVHSRRPWANVINRVAAKLGLRSINIPVIKTPPVATEPWPIARFISNRTEHAAVQEPSR